MKHERVSALVSISICAMSAVCVAGGVVPSPNFSMAVENLEIIDHNTHELNLDLLAKVSNFSQAYQLNMNNYIPLKGLPTNDSGNTISRKILQQSAQHFLDEHKNDFNGSSFVATTSRLNESMKTQYGQGNDSVSLRSKPLEGKAEVEYSAGLPCKSVLSYNAFQNEAQFEMSKDMWGKTFAITHSRSSSEDKQMFGIRWAW